MDPHHLPQPRRLRTPLGDATQHHVNAPIQPAVKKDFLVKNPESRSLQAQPNPQTVHRAPVASRGSVVSTSAPSQAVAKVASAAQIDGEDEKRTSQISTSSSASAGRRKTHVGPWQLGKTLGKGSAGRVRLARHRVTGENVAVKILPKHRVQMTQAGSLQDIDKWDRKQPEFANDNRIPLSIEREIALLKLIEHPNIMRIFDIWENRSEIYLVLEYVNQGDLFEYINTHQYLDEEETVWFFRQIISALDYCHSFNICHRDLKPENILISNDGFIKIADFGMAAIQQSPSHWLRTACGSPHYAAPELVSRKRGYEGHKVDIWSSGVILYACLCGRLPFDDKEGNMHRLLAKAKRGKYYEPEWLSWLSKDLIRRMLQPDPAERISIKQIWEHGLVAQYDHFEEMVPKGSNDELDVVRNQWRTERLRPEDIDRSILRQLRSLWHMYQESELAMKLISKEPNDQKLFYFLLLRYTQRQLENYRSSIPHSPSDFHHLQPPTFKKKSTTLQFPAGYGRSASRFTVISNVATDENGVETATDGGATVKSYDPFKSSQIMGGSDASHAKIIVHRNGSMARSSTRATNMGRRLDGSIRSTSTYSRRAKYGRHGPATAALHSSRRSLASFRSADGVHMNRPVSKHKRGVDFSHMRKLAAKQSNGADYDSFTGPIQDVMAFGRANHADSDSGQQTQPTGDAGRAADETHTKKEHSQSQPPRVICGDDLLHFSSSIAQDCDQAFNSSLLLPDSSVGETPGASSPLAPTLRVPSPDSGSLSYAIDTLTPELRQGHGAHRLRLWDSRPLPPAPPPTDSMLHEATVAKRNGRHPEPSRDVDDHGDRLGSHLAQRKLTGATKQSDDERRAVSAPIYSQYSTQWGKDAIPLPAIIETRKETLNENSCKPRMSSAPVREEPFGQLITGHGREHGGLEYLARQEKTIRMVASPPTKQGPVKAPGPLRLARGAPLATRTKQSTDLRQRYVRDGVKEAILEDPYASSNKSSSTALKKKASWFRRGSKGKDDVFSALHGSSSSRNEDVTYTESNTSTTVPMPPTKKKSFSLAFWRSSQDQTQMQLSLSGLEPDEAPSPKPVRIHSHPGRPPREEKARDDVTSRNIEPQQNWLARLFRVKPATEHLCFTISRRSARQEIAILLKEWRRYGIRDVQVDKDRNIVFGRVGPRNYLSLKEVSFAAEIMTVIEHGNRNALSIVRFTQERGAASSFHKVVDTMHSVFSVRNLLVTDNRKIKMMIKTLNSR